jgi:hypothetical protein
MAATLLRRGFTRAWSAKCGHSTIVTRFRASDRAIAHSGSSEDPADPDTLQVDSAH